MERIPNPFKGIWENFDIDDFKDDIMEIIDDIVDTDGEEADLFDELDNCFGELVLLLKYKESDYMDVVSISDLPDIVLEELGLDDSLEENSIFGENGVLPVELVTKFVSPELVQKLIDDGIISQEDPDELVDGLIGTKKRKNGKDMWLL